MPAIGSLKRLKNIYDKIKKVGGKVLKFAKDKGIDIAIKGIQLLKSGKIDAVLNIVKSFIPQAAVAAEVVDILKGVLGKVDEEELRDALKKALSGDLKEIRELAKKHMTDFKTAYEKAKSFF